MEGTTAIILAAGKGTRMRSPSPKVLHEVCGKTLLACVTEAVRKAGVSQIIVVVGDKKEAVKNVLDETQINIVEQHKQLGTANAVMSAAHLLSNPKGVAVVLNADAPLVSPQTLKRLIALNAETDADATLLTTYLETPKGYGRILRDLQGRIKGIVEESEANPEELKIKEINVGMYAFKVASLLDGLNLIMPHNKKNEFYLTDIISVFYNKGKKIEGLSGADTTEVLGINTQADLAEVNRIRHDEIMRYFMDNGVTIVDPGATFIEDHVEIGKGTTVYPFTYICKNVVIGRQCRIGPFAYLKSGSRIGDNVEIQNMMEKGALFS